MVEIKITDPSASDLPALRALVRMLEGVTGTIDRLDHPSMGKDVIAQPDPNEVFGKVEFPVQAAALPDPADVFGKSPLPNGVTDAPSTAVAGPSTTAPGGTSAISTAPTANLIPAPPSAPSAPIAAHQVPPAPRAPGVDLDANGLPWDARIHASSKARVANGSWRTKKNVAPELVKRVEAELRAVLAIPGTAPAVAVPPPPVELGNVPPPPPAGIATAPDTSTANPSSAPVIAPHGSITTFPQLAEKITTAIIGGLATQPEMSAILSKCGFPSLPLVAARPELIPTVAAKIDEFLAAKAKL